MMTSDESLTGLKDVSSKALTDYDELREKYNKLVNERDDAKTELGRLQEFVEPMYDEYQQIQSKHQVEKELRTVAESYATQVLKDNKKIKRQSAMLMAQMSTAKPIAVDIDIDDDSAVEDERIEQLNNTINKLQDEMVSYKVELEKARDEISILTNQTDQIIVEREEYKFKCGELEIELNAIQLSLKKQQKDLKSLNRVSTLAFTDYTSLEDKYSTEKVLRLKAESYAKELQRKRDSSLDPRQTASSIDTGNESETLKKISAENEKLHVELSEQHIKYTSEIEELEQQLKDSTSHANIENLEEKIEVLKDDLERSTGDLESQRKDNVAAKERIAKLEKERDFPSNIPLPPPPPPPPGPSAGIGLGKLIFSKKKKKDLSKVVGSPAVKDDSMRSAIDEMMARIKAGNNLRSVDMNSRPDDISPQDEEGGAKKEMHGYLVSMKLKKRTQSPSQSGSPVDGNSELAKILSKRRDRSNSIDALESPTENGQRKRSGSIDSVPVVKGVAKEPSLNKQASLDCSHVPKPRPRVAPKPQQPAVPSELAARLNVAFRRTEDDEKEASNAIPNVESGQ